MSKPAQHPVGDRDNVPLIVDLDGTLIDTDSLHEMLVSAFFKSPLRTLAALSALGSGRNHFKAEVAKLATFEPDLLPYREEVLDFLKAEHAAGRSIYLVTAADQSVATAVADQLRLFAQAKGSDTRINLKGINKLKWIESELGPVFDYIGDSRSDLPIWKKARACLIAVRERGLPEELRASGVKFDRVFEPTYPAKYCLHSFRLHQASKNVLVFVPLILSHKFVELGSIGRSFLAFALLTITSSATYLINDLADLSADRGHATKRHRALASGAMSIGSGAAAALALIIFAMTAAIVTSPILALSLVGYLILTLAYSFRLKRVPLLDVFVIAVLFTMRVVVGTAIIYAPWSAWLLPFSLAFFFSLGIAKRHAELVKFTHGDSTVAGRGYRSNDWPLTLALGIGAAMAAIVIMLIYMNNEANTSGLYRNPVWLYATPVFVFLWALRIWFYSHRGILHDDPVVFAIRDKISWLLAIGVAISFFLAV